MAQLDAASTSSSDAVEDLDRAAPHVAVLVPCHNEALSIAKVVLAFRQQLPSAVVYVYDNNSTDRTVAVARAAGAVVGLEHLKGKGNVVRRMFSDVEADAYVLVDGDDTYDASDAPQMVAKLFDQDLDMVTGTRVTDIRAAYRPGHRLGNRILTGIVASIFGDRVSDMLSGYRVFSRRFVKSFPALSSGFETETELTIHALELKMPLGEVDTLYKDRDEGSASKLNTYRDGIRILFTIVTLVKEERPLQFFTLVSALLFLLGVGLGIPLMIEYHRIHLVPRLPTAVLSSAIVILSFLALACGLILDSVARGRKENKRMAYLAVAKRFRFNADRRMKDSAFSSGVYGIHRSSSAPVSEPHASTGPQV